MAVKSGFFLIIPEALTSILKEVRHTKKTTTRMLYSGSSVKPQKCLIGVSFRGLTEG